jgi:hypothetical protein
MMKSTGDAARDLENVRVMRSFAFQRRRGRIDWRQISNISVRKTIEKVDVGMLQDIVDMLAFSRVEQEELALGCNTRDNGAEVDPLHSHML